MATHNRVRWIKNKTIENESVTSQQEQFPSLTTIQLQARTRKHVIFHSLIPISNQTKQDHHWTSFSKGPPELIKQLGSIAELQNTSHILIKKGGNEFIKRLNMKMNCAYELVNSQGQIILFACETKFDSRNPDVNPSKCWKRQPIFDITVIGGQWDTAFNVVCDRSNTSVSTKFEYIGQIISTTLIPCRCSKPNSYKIQDCNGNTTYTVKYIKRSSIDGFPPEFRIIEKSTGTTIGNITCDWESGEFPTDSIYYDYYGVKLSDAMDFKHRLLMIGTLFTIIGTQGFYTVNRLLKSLEFIELEEAKKQETK